MPTLADMSTFWYTALNEPLGVWLKTPDVVQLKNHLYSARTKLQAQGDRSLDHLQVRTSPQDPEGTLWIANPRLSED